MAMSELPYAIANSAYLFLVLHLLFVLTVVWQSIVAAALLVAFLSFSCLESVTSGVPETRQQPRGSPNAEHVVVGSSTVDVKEKEDGGGTEVFVSAVYASRESPSLPHEECSSVVITSWMKRNDDLLSSVVDPSSNSREGEPCSDAGNTSAELYSPLRNGADDTIAYVGSALDMPNTERLIAENVHTEAGHDDEQVAVQHSRRDAPAPQSQVRVQSFYLAPRNGWVFATAVTSFATVCASGVLFGCLYTSEQADLSSADSILPGWVTTPVAKLLLTVCFGVPVDSPNAKWQFCWTAACLTVVSLTSWCLLLCRVLGRCAHEAHEAASLTVASSFVTSTSTWSRVRVWWIMAVRLLAGFITSAPYSLVWVCVAGVGQATTLGLLSLAVAMTTVLLFSSRVGQVQRQREGNARQRLWSLYTCMLLFLWEVQMIVLLPSIQQSLKTTSVWAKHGRWLAAVGAVPAASHNSMPCWRIIAAIGLWWAGAEFVCYYGSVYGTSPVARFNGGRERRALLRRGLAQRDGKQWSDAIDQQRAAHGKLQELRLERDAYLFRSSRGSSGSGPRRTRAPQQHVASWCRNHQYAQHDRQHMAGHAPFGTSVSHCFWMDRDDSQHLPSYVSSRSDSHEYYLTLLHNKPFSASNARVHGNNACGTADALRSSPLYSNSSVCGCLPGQPVPWQYSEITSTLPSLTIAESESTVGLIAATATVVLSESAAEPLKHHDSEVASSPYMWQGWSRAPTRSSGRGGVEGNEDDAGVRHRSCGAYSNGEHSVNRCALPLQHSCAHYPYAFSVASSGPRASHSRLRGVTYVDVSLRQNGSSGGSSNKCWPPTTCGMPPGVSVADGASSFEEAAARQCLSLPPKDQARPEQMRAEYTTAPPTMTSDGGARRSADGCALVSLLLKGLRSRARLAAHKVLDLLGGYLQRHTAPLPAEVDDSAGECPTGPRADAPHAQRQRCRQSMERMTKHSQAGFTSAALSTDAKGVTALLGTLVGAPPSSTSHPETIHVRSLWKLLELCAVQHWPYLCALLMLVQFTVSGTVVNLVPSLASIVYALLQRPWPPLWYWRLQMLFSSFVFLVKSGARVYLLTMGPSVSLTTCRWLSLLVLRVDVAASSAPAASLLSPLSSTMFGSEFHRYMWVDLALSGCVVAAVAIQWSIVYPDHCVLWRREGERDAPVSVSAAVLTSMESTGASAHERRHDDPHRGVAELCKICKRHLRCWNAHRCGAGADYYAAQLFFDGLSLVLFGCAYYAIVPEGAAISEGNLLHAVQQNHLPGIFVVTALGFVVVLFLERILYVLRALVAKYVLHFFLATVYHTLYVLWHTVQESKRGRGATTSVATTASVSLLLAAKFASLWCSALQLRHGYALHRLHDPFTIKTDLLHWVGHVTFRAVPFLMELRVLLDWSFSATALKVQHWMLLEDIHHTVYRRYVDMHDLHYTSHHQGRSFPYLVRLYQGVFGFTVILLVLFFPLFWYSTFSPQVRASHVTGWSTEVTFARMSPVPLFSADSTVCPSSFHEAAALFGDGTVVRAEKLLRYAAATDTWQTAHVAPCSTRMWSYTPAALWELLDRLGKTADAVTLVVRNRVTRDRASEPTRIAVDFEESYTLPPASQALLAEALKAWHAADSADSADTTDYLASPWRTVVVPLPSLYAPYVLSSGAGISFFSGLDVRGVNCSLTLHRVGKYSGFSCLTCAEDGQRNTAKNTLATDAPTSPAGSSKIASAVEIDEKSTPLAFVIVSKNVAVVQSSFSLIPSVGIIALYTSFVLVMSSYIRNYFAGDAHRVVLLQLANPEPVAELLRYLYLARSSANSGQVGDLVLEQLLFVELLDLLRSPERLLRLGGRRVDDYADSTYRQALFEATKRPFSLPEERRR
ncbi:conserved hypothetical protein [Leishmania braziliensis MHOM/BR/75/M2904]|uniref:Uncharacterized protein n=2 Tax=Leishmania braziliensis TaxID=5660 RepID=A4HAP4_LEIBR|nr:conserved hypothetical protein [Leishmania braziliensis MHOM/BR/75/M2904]CAJ2471209.1 unnamed protein product [Leishmania braziliensis]CAM38476.1 conserved hypothetical protein [Leishmania braziliensis MHOM/BR/75/M2904]SYZ65133.1 Protein_of_uncharacterised_function_(DUF3595) [Leishmania braziliensis MHOM/BR/75/M2904]